MNRVSGAQGPEEGARTGANGIQSIEMGMRVLRSIADRPLPLSLREIAGASGLTPSNTHRYLVSLVKEGLVSQDPENGKYSLGSYALQLGLTALGRLEPDAVASRAMHALRDQIDRTVMLSIWTANGPVLVRWLDASQPISVSVKLGQRVDLLISTSGRIFLGFEKWSSVHPILVAELARRRASGSTTLTTLDEARLLRSEVLSNGLSRVLGDAVPGMYGLSAPIFNSSGELAMTLSTVGLAQTFNADYHGDIAAHLRRIAANASLELGYQPRKDPT